MKKLLLLALTSLTTFNSYASYQVCLKNPASPVPQVTCTSESNKGNMFVFSFLTQEIEGHKVGVISLLIPRSLGLKNLDELSSTDSSGKRFISGEFDVKNDDYSGFFLYSPKNPAYQSELSNNRLYQYVVRFLVGERDGNDFANLSMFYRLVRNSDNIHLVLFDKNHNDKSIIKVTAQSGIMNAFDESGLLNGL